MFSKLKMLLILLLILVAVFLYYNINPSNVDFLPKCPIYSCTGLYCTGCGSQRATHHLLHLNFLGVLKYNLLYLFGLFIVAYHIIVTLLNKLFNKNIYNYLYHSKTPIIILIVVVLFTILRNIPIYPFSLLAPLP